ncbi:acyl-CoA dehydrogenase family protein [Sphingomonas jatrophae]|uniref:Acyl-CoA dehydrogenase n=1 Tax=Sphingomonas jatrophae TaxID=1166337 RepID=A0A1I6KJM1_9SPHN|nr:acyl-CoA dehydrogenase family protein [Sphingomonas jatrophae]SFR91429.1 Acyl-CoA dehydrogenase [Sphingomonas jatrophae]
MQFAETSEQTLVAETARGLFADFAATLRETIAGADGFDRAEWMRAVGEMGFGGIAVPEALGGAGLGPVELALVAIESGTALWPSPFVPSIATAIPLLIATGLTEAVPALASGERIATILFAGDAAFTREGDGWRVQVEGLAPFGQAADLLLVVGATRLAVVSTFGAEPRLSLDLTRPLAAVSVDGMADAAVADAGPAIADALDRARVMLAAECLGAAEAALARTVDYAKQRVQFGRAIGSFQALKHRMADMMIATEAARSAVLYAATAAAEGDAGFAEAAAIAHFTAIETLQHCARDQIQLHGGIGFTWEHDAHLFFRRAQGAATLLGTPAASRARLARLIGLDVEAA